MAGDHDLAWVYRTLVSRDLTQVGDGVMLRGVHCCGDEVVGVERVGKNVSPALCDEVCAEEVAD